MVFIESLILFFAFLFILFLFVDVVWPILVGRTLFPTIKKVFNRDKERREISERKRELHQQITLMEEKIELAELEADVAGLSRTEYEARQSTLDKLKQDLAEHKAKLGDE